MKNISPAAYFQNFTAFGDLLFFSVEATIESFQKIQHKVNLRVFSQAQAQVCRWEERLLEGIESKLADMVSAAQECAEVEY